MTVNLYNTPDEQNVIGKVKTLIDTATCTIKGNISYENPVLLLQYDSSVVDNINYMEIPELNRCYFITDLINLTGGRYEIHAKVDVLESFKNVILNLSAIIDKGQNGLVNMFIDDGSFICENKEFNSVLNFPYGFNNEGEYILITAGGGGGII